MTIEREGGDRVIECDRVGCRATFKIEAPLDFASGFAEAKRLGWAAKKIGNEWVHGCPLHARDI